MGQKHLLGLLIIPYPKPLGAPGLDGSPMPLGSTATHEPTGVKPRVGRWKSLEGVCDVLHPLGTNGRSS